MFTVFTIVLLMFTVFTIVLLMLTVFNIHVHRVYHTCSPCLLYVFTVFIVMVRIQAEDDASQRRAWKPCRNAALAHRRNKIAALCPCIIVGT